MNPTIFSFYVVSTVACLKILTPKIIPYVRCLLGSKFTSNAWFRMDLLRELLEVDKNNLAPNYLAISILVATNLCHIPSVDMFRYFIHYVHSENVYIITNKGTYIRSFKHVRCDANYKTRCLVK